MNKLCKIIFGLFIGYISYKKICIYGHNHKECPLKNINRINKLHFHHWIIHLILLFLFKNNCFLVGINLGGILHGILEYDDWYKLFD